MKEKDTIVSIATPMGTGALSIIRCSGEEVSKIIDIFLKKKLSPRHAHYINFKNKDNIVVDDIIAIFYDSPKSYTGENMLEIICHGGPVIYQLIIDEILKLEDCRLAKAGEFSERAFLNNKISITQAESISALINAKTKEAAIAARESMSGKITQDIQKIDSSILNARVQVEALLDFSEEDVEFANRDKLNDLLEEIKAEIEKLIEIAGNYSDEFDEQEKIEVELDATAKKAISLLITELQKEEDPEDIQNTIYQIAKGNDVQPKDFFKILYQIILGTSRGPKIGPFITDIGRKQVAKTLAEYV